MEPHSWSPKATANGIDKKRHVFLDEEDTNKGCKRACVEPFQRPMGLDALSDLNSFMPSWEAKTGTMYPSFQFTETASELTNSLEVHSPTPFKVEPSILDSAHLLSNHGEVFGASHSAGGGALTSIANLPFMFPDPGFGAQTLGPGSSTPAVTNMSQHNDDEYLLFPLNPHDYQIQQVNNLGVSCGTDLCDSNTDLWANSAASLSHHPNSSPQEWLQYLTPVQSQNIEMSCFPANVENSTVETGIKTGLSTEWSCMDNEVNLLESESTMNVEMETTCPTPGASESSITAMNSGKPGRPLKPHGVSSLSSNLLTELTACDKVSDSESIIELSAVPQYDACFGVVSHRRLTSD
jgi:hypothetical protein